MGAWTMRCGPASGSNRVNRGGSWNNNADNCRVANRNNNRPDNENDNLGFRLVSTTHEAMCAVPSTPAGAPRTRGQTWPTRWGKYSEEWDWGNAPAGRSCSGRPGCEAHSWTSPPATSLSEVYGLRAPGKAG